MFVRDARKFKTFPSNIALSILDSSEVLVIPVPEQSTDDFVINSPPGGMVPSIVTRSTVHESPAVYTKVDLSKLNWKSFVKFVPTINDGLPEEAAQSVYVKDDVVQDCKCESAG